MILGVLLMLVGMVILLESLGVTQAGLREWWPLLLIGLGLLILFERLRRQLRRR